MLLLAPSHAKKTRQKRFTSGLLFIPAVRWGKKTTKGQRGKVILRKSTPASLLLVKGDNCFWDACAALGCESFVFGRNGIIFLSPHGTRPTEYAAPPVESGHKKHSVIITVVLPCSEWEHSQTIQGHTHSIRRPTATLHCECRAKVGNPLWLCLLPLYPPSQGLEDTFVSKGSKHSGQSLLTSPVTPTSN